MAEVPEDLNEGVSDELEAFVPEALPTSGVISTAQKYHTLYLKVYETLQVQQIGGTQHLQTTFCTLNDADLESFRGIIPEFAGIQANAVSLFHILYCLKHATVTSTRDQKVQLVTAMSKDRVNGMLRAGFAEQGDNRQDADYLIILFKRLVNCILSSITMLHEKSRLGILSYCWFKKLQRLLRKLQTKCQEMQFNLVTRNQANATAHDLVRCRAKTLETLNNYAKLTEPTQQANCRMFLEPFNVVNAFAFAGATGLNTIVENRSLWSTFILVNDFEATEVQDLEDLRNTLNDLFKDIKSYVPSDMDKANDVAINLRPAILATCEDYDKFITSDVKTLGMATSLMQDIEGHRSSVQQLQSNGLIINEASVGSTSKNLQTMYAFLSDFVHEEQKKARLAETKAKIELQELSKASANVKLSLRPLTGIHAWLSFFQSYQEIIPLHKSELVKAEVVREALRDRRDKKYCLDLNHEDIMSYLKSKYDDSSNIPQLILEITGLPRPTNYQQSHDNVLAFKEMCMHLKHHKAEYRLDSATRDKLLPVLLPENLQLDFLKSRRQKETQWKQDLNLDDPTDADDIFSTISTCNDERLEERRRDHFIFEMSECLPILRHLMKNMTVSSSSSTKGRGDKGSYKGSGKDSKTHARMMNLDEDSSSSSNSDDDNDDSSDCPICYVQHLDKKGRVLMALSRCPKFWRMDTNMKHKVIKRSKHCMLCLRYKDPGTHSDGNCQWAQDRPDLICYMHEEPEDDHHPLLCRDPLESRKDGGSIKDDD